MSMQHLLCKIPTGHSSSNDDMLTSNDELSDPENAKDVQPSHVQNQFLLLVGNESCLGITMGISQGFDDEESHCPTSHCDHQSQKGLWKRN